LPPNRWRGACLETPRAAAIRFQIQPVCQGKRDTFSEQRLIAPRALGSLSDRPQVSEVFHLHGRRVKRVRQCLEPARRLLDPGVRVLHLITSSSQEPAELGPQR
jgi:hypothetical protein